MLQNAHLHEWFERLRKEDMPAFGTFAHEIARLTSERSSPTSALANVILQDPSMTARVLRVANSAFYSKVSQVTTVSRAITLMGFDVVSRICLSVALVDSLLKGKPQKALVRELARSFYAAILARTMAEKRRDESPEEVFIAALLYRLGAMAFWCYGGDSAEALEARLESSDGDSEKEELRLLGFRLDELTVELAQEWHLGDLVARSHLAEDGNNEKESDRSRGIVLAHAFTRALRKPEQKDERRTLIKLMSRHSQVPPETMEELIRTNAELAVEFAKRVGADIAIPEIPGQQGMTLLENTPPSNIASAGEPDAQLQLKILRELHLGVSLDGDPDTPIQLALEGLYRGVGLDRVVFLRLTETGDGLRAQFALGQDTPSILHHFSVSLENRNVLAESCRDDQSIWAPILPEAEKVLFSEEVQQILQNGPFLFSPLKTKDRLIGGIYADRLPSGRSLDRECSESFELFCFQLKATLSKGR